MIAEQATDLTIHLSQSGQTLDLLSFKDGHGTIAGSTHDDEIQSPLGSRVLRAKLRAPTAPEHFVRRARLHRLLDEVATAPVTLVVAPAGAGKTSLLSGWTAESATPICWLTLDETDRGAAQLWSGVIEALATRILGCGEQARALLQHPESVLAGIDNLLEDLDLLLTSSTVLVLDDVHLIDDDEAVNSSLAYFVQHVPPLLHVVLASRRVQGCPWIDFGREAASARCSSPSCDSHSRRRRRC